MRATPPQVKSEIIRKYLEGYPETEIAKLFNVSVAHVSSIAKEESTKDGYYLVIREVVKMFKSNKLELSGNQTWKQGKIIKINDFIL